MGQGPCLGPTAQRPELWNLYNRKSGPEETMRVFPLANRAELDIWQYISVDLTGIDSPYEVPEKREIVLDTIKSPAEQLWQSVYGRLR
jgi:hypothetical protein